MERYELGLMLYKTLSSSPAAIAQTLKGVIERLKGDEDAKSERDAFEEMLNAAEAVKNPVKVKTLLKVLDICFKELRKRGAAKKTVIFTENRTKQRYLKTLLESKYKVLTYSGNNRDYDVAASNSETAGRFHTNWLNMIYPLLRLAANLLRDDGVIFISIVVIKTALSQPLR